MIRRAVALLFAITLSTLLPAATALAADLLIAVSSNFLATATELADAFEKQSGTRVRISSGSTGKLYAQIIHGAPYSLFLAANAREPQRLEAEGYVVKGSRFTYASGQLVLWSLDPQLLKQNPGQRVGSGRFKSITLANPATAPYGAAAQQVLERLQLRPGGYRLLRAENVTQAYQYVATGSSELGFIAYSQLLSGHQQAVGSHWLVPQKYHSPIHQQAVLLKRAADNDAARAFMAFLQVRSSRALIERYGYRVAAP